MHKILETLLGFVIAIIVWIGKTQCNGNISISDSRYIRFSVYWAVAIEQACLFNIFLVVSCSGLLPYR